MCVLNQWLDSVPSWPLNYVLIQLYNCRRLYLLSFPPHVCFLAPWSDKTHIYSMNLVCRHQQPCFSSTTRCLFESLWVHMFSSLLICSNLHCFIFAWCGILFLALDLAFIRFLLAFGRKATNEYKSNGPAELTGSCFWWQKFRGLQPLTKSSCVTKQKV